MWLGLPCPVGAEWESRVIKGAARGAPPPLPISREEDDDQDRGGQDFGPIAEGAVDLKPLTVFIVAENSGKSYM